MPQILKTLLILLFVFGAGEFTTSPAFSAERINVEYHHSEISFTGDDSFVTGRYTWKPLPRSSLWRERITFAGGIMEYEETGPGYYFTGENEGKDVFARKFNKNPHFIKLGLSIIETDIIELSNEYGRYYLVSNNNDRTSCGIATQFSGDIGTADGLLPIGTKVATVYLCKRLSWGSKFKLNKFIQDIMDRARYDEGKLNKMRAAARK